MPALCPQESLANRRSPTVLFVDPRRLDALEDLVPDGPTVHRLTVQRPVARQRGTEVAESQNGYISRHSLPWTHAPKPLDVVVALWS